jgi:ferredoxin
MQEGPDMGQILKGAYDMSLYEITFSPTGGTRKIAAIVSSVLGDTKTVITLLPKDSDYHVWQFKPSDICVIAVPSFGGRVPAVAAKRIQCMQGNGANAVLVCAYGNRAYDDTLLELSNTVKEAGFHPVAAIAAVARHSIMTQFAAGRPDIEDEKEIKTFAAAVKKKVISGNDMEEVIIPGNKPYREYHGVPFKPDADQNCNQCGLCAKECPVGAIDADNLTKTNTEQCISCMRCIDICPQKARKIDKRVLDAAILKMSTVLTARKKNEFFL